MIVVIAILAGISVVAYRGIQNKARDTAVLSEATSLGKLAQMKHATDGTYGHGDVPPTNRNGVLGLYDAAALSGSLHVVGHDAAAEHGDKNKVHIIPSWGELWVGYWSHQKGVWIHIAYSDGEDFPITHRWEDDWPPRQVF